MNKPMVLGIAVVVAALGVVGYFVLGSSATQQSATPTAAPETVSDNTQFQPSSQPASTSSADTQGSVKEFTVESAGLNFAPNTLSVKMGDKVKITYKNTKGSHDFRIDEFNVKTKLIAANTSETVEFTADKKGSFEFYCSVPGHRQAGMKGTLVVE